jgi:FKBP-type peptidyl-prolyl cis-trans isomerase
MAFTYLFNMKHLQFIFILACISLVACTPKYIKQYEKTMIKDPTTQAEKDQNKILQYLTESKLEFQFTESGIYYDITGEGDGTHPNSSSIVNVHYKGYMLDSAGTVFDSSYERGEPIEFPLTNVIPGWQESIPLLQIGQKGTFLIPSEIAYGERGAGSDIPPHTVLAFDVELLDHYKPEDKIKRQAEKDQKLITEYLATKTLATQETESGIHYNIEKVGTGKNPTADDIVKVHYKGTLLDGTVFDSSYDRGEPITFPLARVVPGWQESIPLLKEGGKGTFLIPSALAYGEAGAGGVIPPNAVLSFEVELLQVMDEVAIQKEKDEQAKKANEKVGQQASLDEDIIKKYVTDNKLDAKRTPEGIYYTTERAGSAPMPTINSSVTVHYKGTLLDGTVFDSSYDRGTPATFPLKGVVKGWQIGIPLFGTGGKGTLIIPSGLAYGPNPRPGGKIKPNDVLIFEVEVIEVK